MSLEFRERNRGAERRDLSVWPHLRHTLGFRGSIEELPTIRINFGGAGAPASYELTGGRAYDVGVGFTSRIARPAGVSAARLS